MKSNWKKYGIIAVILIVSFFMIRNKYFYISLFSEKFCDSIIEIQYVTYENEVYRITDEKVVRDFADALCNNKYKKIPVIEGSDTFILVTEDAEYDVCMSSSHITWKGKYYEPKVEFLEIYEEVWDYLGMD